MADLQRPAELGPFMATLPTFGAECRVWMAPANLAACFVRMLQASCCDHALPAEGEAASVSSLCCGELSRLGHSAAEDVQKDVTYQRVNPYSRLVSYELLIRGS